MVRTQNTTIGSPDGANPVVLAPFIEGDPLAQIEMMAHDLMPLLN